MCHTNEDMLVVCKLIRMILVLSLLAKGATWSGAASPTTSFLRLLNSWKKMMFFVERLLHLRHIFSFFRNMPWTSREYLSFGIRMFPNKDESLLTWQVITSLCPSMKRWVFVFSPVTISWWTFLTSAAVTTHQVQLSPGLAPWPQRTSEFLN